MMPETRYVEVYKDGKLIDKEPYEVSDEQLEREAAERIIAELSALADGDLKVPQVGKFLKALAKLRR
jgi:hypothetical protein